MIEHFLGGSETALFVCANGGSLTSAVRANMGINDTRPPEHSSSPSYVLPDGLPGAVLMRVKTTLKDPNGTGLLVKRLPQLDRQVNSMSLPSL